MYLAAKYLLNNGESVGMAKINGVIIGENVMAKYGNERKYNEANIAKISANESKACGEGRGGGANRKAAA